MPLCCSVLTGKEVYNYTEHKSTFAYRFRQALVQRLCSSTHPLPVKQIYSEICNRCRMVEELIASKPSRRIARSVEALQFLRRHNVLMHSLLFYAEETDTWNVTSEFSRLAIYGESVMRCELEARLFKLFPDISSMLFAELLHLLISNSQFVDIFDIFQMEQIVGARVEKRRRKEEHSYIVESNQKSEECNKNYTTHSNVVINKTQKNVDNLPRYCEDDVTKRKTHLSDFQKCNMLCAIIGEMHWFAARTKAIDRTHNNAIFPPSDVLILHVLCVHLLETIPAEIIMRIINPQVEEIKQNWLNEPMSIPSQMREKPHTISALSLSSIPHFPATKTIGVYENNNDYNDNVIDSNNINNHNDNVKSSNSSNLCRIRPLTKLPEVDFVKSTMKPQWNMKYIKSLAIIEKSSNDTEKVENELLLSDVKTKFNMMHEERTPITSHNERCVNSKQLSDEKTNKKCRVEDEADKQNDLCSSSDNYTNDLISRRMVVEAIRQCKIMR